VGKIVLTKIGALVSGDVNNPLIKADSVLIESGLIKEIGSGRELEKKANQVIDTNGMTVAPGLIDSHCHPVFGDFTPKQFALNFIENSLHGGVTTIISAGEVHLPGRPRDPESAKALAYLAYKSFTNYRPAGVKVHAGALILESGLTEEDFKNLASKGVWLVGEVGLGSAGMTEAKQMVKWAQENGMKVTMHAGGVSIGAIVVGAKDLLEVGPDIVSHINGGPTAMPPQEIEEVIAQGEMAFEIVTFGNPKMTDFAIRQAQKHKALHRVIIGNDAPSGAGLAPVGVLRTLTHLASVDAIPPETAIAFATGNTARVYGLDVGLVARNMPADLIVMDCPKGSIGEDALSAMAAGDCPSVALVMIDGEVLVTQSRNTMPPLRKIEIR
jgi:enamidase